MREWGDYRQGRLAMIVLWCLLRPLPLSIQAFQFLPKLLYMTKPWDPYFSTETAQCFWCCFITFTLSDSLVVPANRNAPSLTAHINEPKQHRATKNSQHGSTCSKFSLGPCESRGVLPIKFHLLAPLKLCHHLQNTTHLSTRVNNKQTRTPPISISAQAYSYRNLSKSVLSF